MITSPPNSIGNHFCPYILDSKARRAAHACPPGWQNGDFARQDLSGKNCVRGRETSGPAQLPKTVPKPCRCQCARQCHVLTPGGAELPDMTTNACCHHLPCVRGLFLWPGGLRTSTTNALAASICCCCGCGVLRGCRWLQAALNMQRPTRGSTSHITHASEKPSLPFLFHAESTRP